MWPIHRKATSPNLGRVSARELVALARNASGAALQEIMRRNGWRLFRVARSILGSDLETEEVVLKAFSALAHFREVAQLSTWPPRIINEAQGRLRRRREHLPLDELDDRAMGEIIPFPGGSSNLDPEREAALSEIRGLVEQSIDALPEPFREVFVLRELEGFSVEETAQLLALAPETVKTRLHRARTRLRQTLQDQLAPALQDTFPFEGVRCRRLSGAVLRRLALSPGPT